MCETKNHPHSGLVETIDWKQYGIEKVIESENAQSALAKVQTGQVDIMIADIRMPGMSGLELAAKAKELYPEIRIILLTGYSEFEYAKRAISIGVDEYFLKPVRVGELVETVRRLSKKVAEERKYRKIIKKYDRLFSGNTEENGPVSDKNPRASETVPALNKKEIAKDTDKSKWFIEKCKQYMERHFADNITLEDLSSYVGRNPSYISHVFKQVEGRSFSDYMNGIRVEKAKELLERSNMHIYEVAGNVGFSDYRHFNNVFKKISGVSPSEYKNKRHK